MILWTVEEFYCWLSWIRDSFFHSTAAMIAWLGLLCWEAEGRWGDRHRTHQNLPSREHLCLQTKEDRNKNLIHPRENDFSNQQQHTRGFQDQLFEFSSQLMPEMNAPHSWERGQMGKTWNMQAVLCEVLLSADFPYWRHHFQAVSQSLFPTLCYVNSNLHPIIADTLQMLLWIMLSNQVKMCHFHSLFAYPLWFLC